MLGVNYSLEERVSVKFLIHLMYYVISMYVIRNTERK